MELAPTRTVRPLAESNLMRSALSQCYDKATGLHHTLRRQEAPFPAQKSVLQTQKRKIEGHIKLTQEAVLSCPRAFSAKAKEKNEQTLGSTPSQAN